MAALFVVMFCDAPTTAAQIGGSRIQRPINTPAFSPYLNLFRSGDNSGPVLNYYGLVRPQLNAIEQGQQLGQGIQALQLQQAQGRQQVIPGMQGGYGYSQLGITGHSVVFQSYSNSGGGGGGFGGGGFSGGGFSGGSFGGAGGFSSGGLGTVFLQQEDFSEGAVTTAEALLDQLEEAQAVGRLVINLPKLLERDQRFDVTIKGCTASVIA